MSTRSRTSFDDARAALLVIAWSLAAFLPSLKNGFNFDDEPMFLQNPSFRGLGPSNLRWMFTTFHMGHYQPLAWVSLAIDYLVWGLNPVGFHLTSLVIHATNAVLVYAIALTIFRRYEDAGTLGARWGAVFAALLFACHPLRVESVAWATERRQVLCAAFLLGATLAYIRRRRLVVVFVLYLLAVFTLAIAAVFPACLVLLDIYPLGRLREGRRVWIEKAIFAAPAIAIVVWAPLAQRATGAAVTLEQYSLTARTAQACYGILFYLWKLLAPFHLTTIYDIEPPVNFTRSRYLLPAIAVAAGTIATILLARRHRAVAVALAAYLLLLLPVLGFFQSGMQLVADRYSYLPCVPLALLAGGAASRVFAPRERREGSSPEGALVAAGLLLLGTFSVVTWKQCEVWKTPKSLWGHALQYHPGATAHHNYAGVLALEGNVNDAIAHLEESIRLNPVHVEGYVNLANLLGKKGEIERAEDLYRRAIGMRPDDFRAHLELGNILALTGRAREAESEYMRAIAIRPASPEAYFNLANLMVKQGRDVEAVGPFRQAIAVEPNTARIHWNLAGVLQRIGRDDEARRELSEVLRIDPLNRDARARLAGLEPNPPAAPVAPDSARSR